MNILLRPSVRIFLVFTIAILTAFASLSSAVALPNVLQVQYWAANGTVYDAVIANNHLYISGYFDYIGPATGMIARISRATGQTLPFPYVDGGEVDSIVSDGKGGWFIGGRFTRVDGIPRLHLAHILSDGRVDPAFNIGIDGQITSLHLIENILYVGGSFSIAGGQTRHNLLSINVTTAQVTSWNPIANGRVNELKVSQGRLFVLGFFSQINGQPRDEIAAFDLGTGALADWTHLISGNLNTMEVSGNTLYLAGQFTAIDGTNRRAIAAIDLTTNAVTDWNPGLGLSDTSSVYAVEIDGSDLFIGGGIGLAQVDMVTGAMIQTWTSLQLYGALVGQIERIGDTLFVQPYHRDTWFAGELVSIDLVHKTITKSKFKADLLGTIGEDYFLGTFHIGRGGVERKNIAALDLATGAPTNWTFDMQGLTVNALYAADNVLYIHRSMPFNTDLGKLTALNLLDNKILWEIPVTDVEEMVRVGNLLYIGGSFISVKGLTRHHLAALDISTGEPTAFQPILDSSVMDLAISGNVLYVGGGFANIDGVKRYGLAAFDLLTGTLTSWHPLSRSGHSIRATALLLVGSTVYVGIDEIFINNESRKSLVAFDATSGTLLPFKVNTYNYDYYSDAGVTKILLVKGNLLVSGNFIDKNKPQGILSLDPTTGDIRSPVVDMDLSYPIYDMVYHNNTLYLVGYQMGFYDGVRNQRTFSGSPLVLRDEGPDTIGVFRPADARFYLRNSNTAGAPTFNTAFGLTTDTPIVGDWDGDGTATVGVWRNSTGTFYLRNTNTSGPIALSFRFGLPGDIPIVGDWDGDNFDEIGVYRPSVKKFYLRNTLSAGAPDRVVSFGLSGDLPIAGDWNGDGLDSVGVWRPSNQTFYITNVTCPNCAGSVSYSARFGLASDLPFAGDWDSDGYSGIGIFRASTGTLFMRNSPTAGGPEITVKYGLNGDKPLAGHWALSAADAPPAAPSFVPRR